MGYHWLVSGVDAERMTLVTLQNSILFVAGTFDDSGGRPSGFASKLATALGLDGNSACNGGRYSALDGLASMVSDYDVVFWMPDVPNDKPKKVRGLKAINPRMLLVTSKRNDSKRYEPIDLVAKALASKSNLLLECNKGPNGLISVTVLDPLGNAFLNSSQDVDEIARVLTRRLSRLRSFTRVPSVSVGDGLPSPPSAEFFGAVRRNSEKFHDMMHGANPSRMLGNCSFRCEKGFPSFRSGDLAFVSRRNIDKRSIGPEGMVAVSLASEAPVEFYGPNKPSVDSPIQVRIYRAVPKANFMLHSHAYIDGAPFTENVVPCGAVEEAQEVLDVLPGDLPAMINLRGHGSLVVASKVEEMRDIPYVPRIVPEAQTG